MWYRFNCHSNRRFNSIESLLVDGPTSTNQVEISEHIVNFFIINCTPSNLVGNLSWTASLLTLLARWRPIGWKECLRNGEVLEVVKAMNSDKARNLYVLEKYFLFFFLYVLELDMHCPTYKESVNFLHVKYIIVYSSSHLLGTWAGC